MNITILFKPISDFCNLHCSYCYYNSSRINIKNRISIEKTKTILKSLSLLDDKTNINFIWHGGEPLLVGYNFFIKIIKLQKEILCNMNIRNGIQTNSILINDKWIKIFKKNNMHVGVSLDGPKFIHDMNRVYKNGKGTYQHVMKSIKELQSNKISYGILSTINSYSLGYEREIFDHFIENNIYKFDLNPCLNREVNYSAGISPMEWANFMIKIFDIWFYEDNPKIKIRFFEEIIKAILGGKATLCSLSKGCSSIYTIDNNGFIYTCDDSNPDENRLSELNENFKSILENNNILKIKRKKFESKVGCQQCEFYDICNAYCPRYYSLGKELCLGLKKIFSHVLNRTKQYI